MTNAHQVKPPPGHTSGGTTRRQALGGFTAALAISAAAPVALTAQLARAAISAPTAIETAPYAEFITISSRLTGIDLDLTAQDAAAKVWAALNATFPSRRVQAFIVSTRAIVKAGSTMTDAAAVKRLTDDGVIDIATKLNTLWYSGMTNWPNNGAETSQVLFYDEALAWAACASFTKPAANCGGQMGYWHEPPPTAQTPKSTKRGNKP